MLGVLLSVALLYTNRGVLGVEPKPSKADTTKPASDAPSADEVRLIRAIQCFEHLRQIGTAVILYSNEHSGKYPPDLGTLLVEEKLELPTFICPASTSALPDNWQQLQSQDQAIWVNAHTDYVYLAAKWRGSDAVADRPMAYDKDDDHSTGMNVLFGDGTVRFLHLNDIHQQFGATAGTERTTRRVETPAGKGPAIPMISMDACKAIMARSQMSGLRRALFSFELDTGRFPTTQEGLGALIHQPKADASGWHQYLDQLPVDPWGRSYTYKCPGSDKTDFELFSSGPDGKPGTRDDVK